MSRKNKNMDTNEIEKSSAEMLPDLALSPEDHGLLNKAPRAMHFEQDMEGYRILIAQTRERYKGNPVAQEEIDSEYSVVHRELLIAMRNKDYQKQAELEEWFRINYPHTSKKYEDVGINYL